MDKGLDNTAKQTPAKPLLARPRPLAVAVIPECVLNGTMTPAQAAQAELQRQRENPSAAPIIPLEVQDQQHVTAWLIAAPLEMARLRGRAAAEQTVRDGTFNEKFAASRAAHATRNNAAPAAPASWGGGVWNALAAVGLVTPAPSVPVDNTTVSTSPPTMPDIQDPDNDDASSSVAPNNNNLLASVIDLGLEIPNDEANGLAGSSLPDTLTNLQIPEAIDRPVNNMPAINVQDHEAVVVSPPLRPTPVDMPAEEIALEEAEEHDAPPLEADAVEEQTAMDEAIAERERLAAIQRQAEEDTARVVEVARLEALATAERERQAEIQRQLDETARIERARAEAILVQQQALLLQQQHQREQEETRIREVAEAAARQRAHDIAGARRSGFL